MSVSMLPADSVPVRQSSVFSPGFLSLAQWNSLPEKAPVPCSSSQAILIPTLLGLHSVLITIYIVYQWHCTYCPIDKHTNKSLFLNWATMITFQSPAKNIKVGRSGVELANCGVGINRICEANINK